jgi:hypothetical protein
MWFIKNNSLNVGGISNFSSDVNITAETSSTGYLNGALTSRWCWYREI